MIGPHRYFSISLYKYFSSECSGALMEINIESNPERPKNFAHKHPEDSPASSSRRDAFVAFISVPIEDRFKIELPKYSA